MEKDRSVEARRCPAMIDAGIDSPSSKEGIDFCLHHCPYPSCVVLENGRSRASLRREKRTAEAKAMWKECYSIKEIAQAMEISQRTVGRYLAE